MKDDIFSSGDVFRAAFNQGLERLLQAGGLSAFILVCANATYDHALHVALNERLHHLFGNLQDRLRSQLQEGQEINEVEEDLLVFLKIWAVGLEKLGVTEKRLEFPWQLQFNPMRSFRPKRITARVPEHLRLPFDENGFHFNKGFMLKEAFWNGELCGRHATLYYNKYPFADLHGLLVPERDSCLPQFLTESHHYYIWQVCEQLSGKLPGVGFGYNALGAFASVNHLHFQMFVMNEPLPVFHPHWQHLGGVRPYPISCQLYTDAHAAWEAIHDLHDAGSPYNLVYLPGRMILFPRRKQGTYPQPGWTSGFTWHELAGGMVIFSREAYERLEASDIESELAHLSMASV